MSSFFENVHQTEDVREGVRTVTTRAFDNFTNALVREQEDVYRAIPELRVDVARHASQKITRYDYASYCVERVNNILTVESALLPAVTVGSPAPEQATAVETVWRVVARELVTNYWVGVGQFVLRKRVTYRQRFDSPAISEQGDRYLYDYSPMVPEITVEKWDYLGRGLYHYSRTTERVTLKSGRLTDEQGQVVVSLEPYRRSLIESFSEVSDKPPPVANCVILAEDEDESPIEQLEEDADPRNSGTIPLPEGGEVGDDPSKPPVEALEPDGPRIPVDDQEIAPHPPLAVWEDELLLERARGLPVLPDTGGESFVPAQQVTSPLLSVYTRADDERVASLAAAAKQEAEAALAGSSYTLAERQPVIESVMWTPDVIRVSITRDGATGRESIRVERGVLHAADTVPVF